MAVNRPNPDPHHSNGSSWGAAVAGLVAAGGVVATLLTAGVALPIFAIVGIVVFGGVSGVGIEKLAKKITGRIHPGEPSRPGSAEDVASRSHSSAERTLHSRQNSRDPSPRRVPTPPSSGNDESKSDDSGSPIRSESPSRSVSPRPPSPADLTVEQKRQEKFEKLQRHAEQFLDMKPFSMGIQCEELIDCTPDDAWDTFRRDVSREFCVHVGSMEISRKTYGGAKGLAEHEQLMEFPKQIFGDISQNKKMVVLASQRFVTPVVKACLPKGDEDDPIFPSFGKEDKNIVISDTGKPTYRLTTRITFAQPPDAELGEQEGEGELGRVLSDEYDLTIDVDPETFMVTPKLAKARAKEPAPEPEYFPVSNGDLEDLFGIPAKATAETMNKRLWPSIFERFTDFQIRTNQAAKQPNMTTNVKTMNESIKEAYKQRVDSLWPKPPAEVDIDSDSE